MSDLAKRSYTKEFTRNSDGTWFAKAAELPGCMTEGDSQAEASRNLDDAIDGWIAVPIEDGHAIPLPPG